MLQVKAKRKGVMLQPPTGFKVVYTGSKICSVFLHNVFLVESNWPNTNFTNVTVLDNSEKKMASICLVEFVLVSKYDQTLKGKQNLYYYLHIHHLDPGNCNCKPK